MKISSFSPFLILSCLVAPAASLEDSPNLFVQSLPTAAPSVSPSPSPVMVKVLTTTAGAPQTKPIALSPTYPKDASSSSSSSSSPPSPKSVDPYSFMSSKPTSATIPTDNATAAAVETSSSSVGSAVCFDKLGKQTDKLAFTTFFSDSKEITTESTVEAISEAMKKSILDLLQNETVNTTNVEHSLGFWVENITLDSTPVLNYSPYYSVGLKTLSFNMTFSFECCADYETVEDKVFQLLVSFLVKKQNVLSSMYAKNLNDTAFEEIQWWSEGEITTAASSSTMSPSKIPTIKSTEAKTSAPTASPAAKKPKTLSVPSKMVVSAASSFNFTSVTIAQWETTTSAYYTSYYQQTSDFQGATVSAKYSYAERMQYTQEYVIHFSLVVTYTYSSVSVVEVARQALNTTTSKKAYSSTLVENLGVDLAVDSVEYVNPPTSPPTKRPTKKPTAHPTTPPPIISNKSVTETPVKVTSPTVSLFSVKSSKPTSSAPKTVTFPSQMVISASSSFNFTSTAIAEWESTTSEYYTTYYQQTSGLRECSVAAKYENIEQLQDTQQYVLHFTLVVQYQYTSVSQVIEVAKNVLYTSTSKESYSSKLVSFLGTNVNVETVKYSSPQPTKKPTKNPSKTSNESTMTSSEGLATLTGSMTIRCATGSPLNAANFVLWQSVTASYIMSYWSTKTTKVSGLNVTVIPGTIESTNEVDFEYKINFSLNMTFTYISVSVSSIAEYPFAPSDAYKYVMQLSNRKFDIDLVKVEYGSDSSNLTNSSDYNPSASQSNSAGPVSAIAASSAVGSRSILSYSFGMICGLMVYLTA
jgi:hypothetical protein